MYIWLFQTNCWLANSMWFLHLTAQYCKFVECSYQTNKKNRLKGTCNSQYTFSVEGEWINNTISDCWKKNLRACSPKVWLVTTHQAGPADCFERILLPETHSRTHATHVYLWYVFKISRKNMIRYCGWNKK